MSMNEPMDTWISAAVTDTDRALLVEITRQDAFETGMSSNLSATIRRLIRQEGKRRKIDAGVLLEETPTPV